MSGPGLGVHRGALLGLVRNVRLGVQSLLLHKLRATLTAMGVVFGVGSVVAMLAVGEGASAEAMQRIRARGSANVFITAVKAQEEASDNGRRREVRYGPTRADLGRIYDSFSTLRRVAPAKIRRMPFDVAQHRVQGRLLGVTPEWFGVIRRPLLSGRLLAARDNESLAPVIVLSERAARRLFQGNDPLGRWVRAGAESYQVVGVLKALTPPAIGSSGSDAAGDTSRLDTETDGYIPLLTYWKRVGQTELKDRGGLRERVELDMIVLETASPEQAPAIAGAVEAMLSRFHTEQDYAVEAPITLLREAQATKRTFNTVLGSIAGVSLLVGGIGIMNIMLATVTERTKEIGVRRAIGATRSQIVAQFVTESVVLSGAGGLVGVALGIAAPAVITMASGMPTVVRPESVAMAFGISLMVGVVFGVYPAQRAARMDPVQALRRE